MRLRHGTTDATLFHAPHAEAIKQRTDVHGLGQTPDLSDSPQPSWERTRYGDTGEQPPMEAISVQGVGHALPTSGMAAAALTFFGLDQ